MLINSELNKGSCSNNNPIVLITAVFVALSEIRNTSLTPECGSAAVQAAGGAYHRGYPPMLMCPPAPRDSSTNLSTQVRGLHQDQVRFFHAIRVPYVGCSARTVTTLLRRPVLLHRLRLLRLPHLREGKVEIGHLLDCIIDYICA